MAIACELVRVAPSLLIWKSYDPALKADLFSTAITTRNGTFLVDPIPLADAALAQLLNAGSVTGVIVTNSNHLRASADFADRFSIPIFAHPHSFPDQRFPRTKVRQSNGLVRSRVGDGSKICDELAVITIDGAAAGEIVLHYTPNGGMLIIGDALINFEPYGFTFLPHKYCSNEKEMRRSLRKLLTRKAERMLFAHGPPIQSAASARLQQLLGVDL